MDGHGTVVPNDPPVDQNLQRRLAPLVESTVFRIGREAIANAAKHAEATFVEMDLAYGQQGVTLHIRDDGVGLAADVAERAAANGHLGLVGMRERAAQAGGTLAISGVPRAGTELTLTIPLSTQA
ncbi:MAG TPA: ATP-binding protein [Gemmatimonadaceae bacterium]|nr:ATP-binding protein [Gemmatimonadaceae bacterium]